MTTKRLKSLGRRALPPAPRTVEIDPAPDDPEDVGVRVTVSYSETVTTERSGKRTTRSARAGLRTGTVSAGALARAVLAAFRRLR